MQYFLTDDWMDSHIYTRNASLLTPAVMTLRVKVFLQKEGAQSVSYTSGGTRRTQNTINWDAASWRNWRRDLVKVVNEGWSNNLYLVPDNYWMADRRGRLIEGAAPALIQLRLQIRCDIPRESAHVIIRSYRLPDPTTANPNPFWRSNMMAPYIRSHRRCSIRGNEVVGNMDNRDLIPKSTGQIAAIHEFGHYIGLSHVNAANARDDPNGNIAYGATPYQRADVMGSGTRIEEWHAYPWCQRLRRHLGGMQPISRGWHNEIPIQYRTGRGRRRVTWTVRVGNPQPRILPDIAPPVLQDDIPTVRSDGTAYA